ncbi:MAG: 3',5'-cyclic-AMP phosphodiesterase [Pseudomonadales bacterium]
MLTTECELENRNYLILQIHLDNPQQPIRLVQITDSHLGDQAGEALLGMDTDASLGHVLAVVKQEQSSADILLATGDISNGGSVASYQRFRQFTDDIARHALWLPGNHDQLSAMQEVVAEGEELGRLADIGRWLIIMLDSTISGAVGGGFSANELAFLRSSLAQSVDRHVLVCLHHHPISIGCDWLDAQQVNNADEFFAVMDDFTHVRGVLWGHIHQTIDQERKGVKLMATPSSCIQFAPNNATFKLDRQNPGYRWLELHANGAINTAVSRVVAVTFDIDYEHSSGY